MFAAYLTYVIPICHHAKSMSFMVPAGPVVPPLRRHGRWLGSSADAESMGKSVELSWEIRRCVHGICYDIYNWILNVIVMEHVMGFVPSGKLTVGP